jgi:ATP sulfurylase
MTLASGYIWSMPIVFDLSQEELERLGIKPGGALVLTYQQQPLAVLEVQEIYSYDKTFLARLLLPGDYLDMDEATGGSSSILAMTPRAAHGACLPSRISRYSRDGIDLTPSLCHWTLAHRRRTEG